MASKVSRRAIAAEVAAKLTAPGANTRQIMQSLAAYLVDHKMSGHADMIMNDIADELMTRTGLLSVEITTAHPLDDATREQVRSYLKQKAGAKQVDLHESTDSTLIGGLVARTASGELDSSIQTKLRQLTALA